MSVPPESQPFRFVAKQATTGALWGVIVGLYLNLMGILYNYDTLSSPKVVLISVAVSSLGGILLSLFWLWYIGKKK